MADVESNTFESVCFAEVLPEINNNCKELLELKGLAVSDGSKTTKTVVQSVLEGSDTDSHSIEVFRKEQEEDFSVSSEQPQTTNNKETSLDIRGKQKAHWEALYSAVFEGGDMGEVIEKFKSLQEAIIKETFQEEYQKEDEEDETLSKYPKVDQIERPNYQELAKPHQLMDLEKFKAEAGDCSCLLEWLSTVEDVELVKSICGVIGSNLEIIKSAKQRPQKLLELESNFANDLTFKQIKEGGRYTDALIRGVLEDSQRSNELRTVIESTCESTALQIGQFKQFRDQCQAESNNTDNVGNQLLHIKSKLEHAIKVEKEVLVICDQKQVEKEEKFQKLMEANQQETEVLECLEEKQYEEVIEAERILREKMQRHIQTQRQLAVSKAKGAKIKDESNLKDDKMKSRKDELQGVLDEDTKNLEITNEAIRAYGETIHEDGQKITDRNMRVAEQVYIAKEQEGKHDFGDYGIWLLTQIYNYITSNSGRIKREGDRIVDDEENFKAPLSPLKPDEYPEDMMIDYRRILNRKDVNTRNLQKYDDKLEYWEDALMVITRHLQQWTDEKILLSPLMEERQDKIVIAFAQRMVQLLLKAIDVFLKLYGSVRNNNLNDDASGFERRHAFYLNYLIEVLQSTDLSDNCINRPKIQPALQELKKQIQLFQEKTQEYLNDDTFKSLYEIHCNNTSWAAMCNYHQEVLNHLELIFTSDQLLLMGQPAQAALGETDS